MKKLYARPGKKVSKIFKRKASSDKLQAIAVRGTN
jgi:hypothetical protein